MVIRLRIGLTVVGVVDVSRVQLLEGPRAVALYDVLLGCFPMDWTTLRSGIQLDHSLRAHLGYLVSSPLPGYVY